MGAEVFRPLGGAQSTRVGPTQRCKQSSRGSQYSRPSPCMQETDLYCRLQRGSPYLHPEQHTHLIHLKSGSLDELVTNSRIVVCPLLIS